MRDITEEELHQLYCTEKLSINKIAKLFERSPKYISDSLNRIGIEKNPELDDNKKHEVINSVNIDEFSKLYHGGKTHKELSEIFGISERQSKRLREKLGLQRSTEETAKFISKNLEEKLGVSSARKNSEINKKAIQTYKDKTGFENPSLNPEVQQKRMATFIEKYGVDNPFKNSEIQTKIKNTNISRYGVENPKKILKGGNNFSNIKLHPILLNKEDFKNYILSLENSDRNYTTIANKLEVADTTVAVYVEEYQLYDLIISESPVSSYENEIEGFLKEIGITEIHRNRKDILPSKLEIDLYVPEKKIGIEFNGNYWHSEEKKKQLYHQKKSLEAQTQGIFLYQIFEYEWLTKKDKIKNHLKHILCKNDRIIYARKTELVRLSKTEKKQFLDQYHLQGNDNSLIEYGLKLNDELLMVMTFCKARFTKGCRWELSRMCCKTDVTVVGGASKLFKYFVNNILNSGESIVTYNDVAKTRGTVYSKLGFKLLRISKPSYVWWKSHLPVISRYKTQVKNEIKEMHSKGYKRIFDAGNNVWIFKKC